MTRSERWLMVLLRLVGTAGILAIVPVFMPRAWIDWGHQAAGFGPFPDGPVPEYLARCTSMFYVVAGVVQWWFSLDVRRFGRPIAALGIFMLLGGMVLLWIDIQTGMPSWWTVLEGPFSVGLGAVYLVLQFRSRVEVYCPVPTGDASAGPPDEEAEVEAAWSTHDEREPDESDGGPPIAAGSDGGTMSSDLAPALEEPEDADKGEGGDRLP